MDIKEIKELMKAFDGSGITTLNFKDESGSVELKKEVVAAAADVIMPQTVVSKKQSNSEGGFIKSPIVGIAYRSSKPGAEPFVQVGQEVKAGQVLCIIEAMKMFNEIKTDKSGVISEVLFQDGKLVEFDMPLFKIEVTE